MENSGITEELAKAMVDKLMDIGNEVNEIQDSVRRLVVLQKPMEKLQDGVQKMNTIAADGQELMKGMVQWHNQMQGHVAQFERQVQQHELKQGMNELNAAIKDHIDFFGQSVKKEIHYKHFVGKPLVVIVMLVVIAGMLTAGWMDALKWATRSAGTDIKWRYIQTRYEWRQFADSVERWYQADPTGLEKEVKEEERRRRLAGY